MIYILLKYSFTNEKIFSYFLYLNYITMFYYQDVDLLLIYTFFLLLLELYFNN